MITRAEYMANSRELHQAYYLEIAQAAGWRNRISDKMLTRVKAALAAGDKHLNTIPLSEWDHLTGFPHCGGLSRAVRERHPGFGATLSDGVCALKALARYLAEQEAVEKALDLKDNDNL
jgi:uncharacterized protein YmfQ (DUF2313 family)